MAGRRSRTVALLAAFAALGGCVDMFTEAPSDAPATWSGTTTTGNPEYPECGPFLFELAQYQPPGFMWNTVSGRAWPTEAPSETVQSWVAAGTQWWLEGYVTDANFVEFETKMQRPVYFGARPYSVWRGSLDGDRMTMTESGSPCSREVVLVRG
ncbi:MAG: hypothetical protein AB7I59_10175 [Geminicoccaceae bacterium]